MARRFIILITLIPMSAFGQLLDSMKWSFEGKPKLYAKLDTRNSFITNTYSKVRGVKVGLNYRDVTRVGLGFSWLGRKFEKEVDINPSPDITNIQVTQMKMAYFTPYIEYTYFRKGRWESTIPVQFDIGFTWLQYEQGGQKRQIAKGWSILYQPAMTVQYRLIKYLAIGCGIGYRLELIRNDALGEVLTAPIYLIRSKIFFGEMWSDLFKS